jgi:hypothetical protein
VTRITVLAMGLVARAATPMVVAVEL